MAPHRNMTNFLDFVLTVNMLSLARTVTVRLSSLLRMRIHCPERPGTSSTLCPTWHRRLLTLCHRGIFHYHLTGWKRVVDPKCTPKGRVNTGCFIEHGQLVPLCRLSVSVKLGLLYRVCICTSIALANRFSTEWVRGLHLMQLRLH